MADTGLKSNGYTLVQCRACSAVMAAERPQPEELVATYNHLFESGSYAQHREEFLALKEGRPARDFYRTRLIGQIEKQISGRTLIEIGGGTGAFGMMVRARGWQYRDLDISASAVGYAKQLGLDAEVFDPSGVPSIAPESADVIAMWEVLEHVWDVRRYLDVARRSLRTGGVLMFSTPNYLRTNYRRNLQRGVVTMSPPVHVNFFTEVSIRRALQAAGFVTVQLMTRRLYAPSANPAGIWRSVKLAVGLEEPPTLFGLAHQQRPDAVRPKMA